MRHAIIESGVVTNVVLADEQFAAEQGWTAAPDDVGPGWLYVNGGFSPPASPVKTLEQIQVEIEIATETRLNAFAATRGYNNLDSISKYKDISDIEIESLPLEDRSLVIKFRTECRYLALVTAQTWAVLYRGLEEIKSGQRPQPASFDEIESELPQLAWPV